MVHVGSTPSCRWAQPDTSCGIPALPMSSPSAKTACPMSTRRPVRSSPQYPHPTSDLLIAFSTDGTRMATT